MQKTFWISFDLGIKGDYEGFYAWLDDHEAVECGNNVAFIKFESIDGDFLDHLKKDLQSKINIQERDRIYVIWKNGHKYKGRFIFGKRKNAPWSGYGSKESAIDEEI